MPRIAVDALGGDKGPGEVVAGAVEAAADGIDVLIVGPPGLETSGLPLRPALEMIEMAEKPTEAVRAKPDSSLVSAVRAVAEGEADAVVSAGNTGAVLAAGLLHLRRLPGVLRPAIAVSLPAREGSSVLLDAGANADARAEHLLQFAHMGAVFCEEILDVPNPTVRLLSIGEEDEKGSALVLDAHALLRAELAELRRQRREPRPASRRRGRRRDGRLHREHRAEAARGNDQGGARRAPRRRSPRPPPASSAACSSSRPRGGCAPASIRTPTAARISSA